MRKISVILVILLLFNITVLADACTLKVTPQNGENGRILVNVSIENNPGIAAFVMKLNYDNKKVKPVALLRGNAFNEDVSADLKKLDSSSTFVVAVYAQAINFNENGVLFSIEFEVLNSGEASFNLTHGDEDIINDKGEAVTPQIKNGSIIVTKTSNTGNNGIALVEQSQGFADTESYSWAKNEILALSKAGIIKGVSDKEFAPANNIKRADFILMLMRMLKIEGKPSSNFADVSKDKYYYDAVGLAREKGFIKGVGADNFAPEEYISRQDMFVMAYRILALTDNASYDVLANFEDSSQISSYAKDAFAVFVSKGLIKGDKNTLNPLKNTTRAETAVFVYRLWENSLSN